MTRTITGSTLKYRARPPQTPPKTLSWLERVRRRGSLGVGSVLMTANVPHERPRAYREWPLGVERADRARQAERPQELRAGKAGELADVLALEREHDEAVGVRALAARLGQVAREGGLAVGARDEQAHVRAGGQRLADRPAAADLEADGGD